MGNLLIKDDLILHVHARMIARTLGLFPDEARPTYGAPILDEAGGYVQDKHSDKPILLPIAYRFHDRNNTMTYYMVTKRYIWKKLGEMVSINKDLVHLAAKEQAPILMPFLTERENKDPDGLKMILSFWPETIEEAMKSGPAFENFFNDQTMLNFPISIATNHDRAYREFFGEEIESRRSDIASELSFIVAHKEAFRKIQTDRTGRLIFQKTLQEAMTISSCRKQ
jgi:hypothetical protein